MLQRFDDTFQYAQARKRALKEFEHKKLKEKIQAGTLGYKTDADVIAWARYYTLCDELGKKQELF